MKSGEVLFKLELPNQPKVRIVTLPYDSPRGNRLRLEVEGAKPVDLLEGNARHLHLACRYWVRQQKALRGDTPRGRAKLEAKEAAHVAPGR